MLHKLSWEQLLLVRSEILGMFHNTLADHDKYSRRDMENILQQIQMKLSQKPKPFSNFSLHFSNLHEILSILRKKMSLIA